MFLFRCTKLEHDSFYPYMVSYSFFLKVIIFWLPLIVLAYLFWVGILPLYLPYFLIVIYALIIFLSGIVYPAWFSWMGDLVPGKERGKYFAKRNKIAGFAGILAFIIGAFLLDYFKTKGFVLLGFSAIFMVGIFFRFISIKITRKIFNPDFRVRKGYYFSFWSFLKVYDNFGKFAVYQAAFFFAVMISAPFFAVYMLENLGFSYVTFTMVALSPSVFFLLFSSLAGKFSDKYGNVKLLYIAGFSFPLVPLLWIFLKNPVSLILFPGLIAGIANAAFIIGVTDFTYDAVSPQKRGLCIAYTGLLTGIGIFLGSIVGGILIQYLPVTFIKPIFFVFLASMTLMIITSLFFLPQIKEERKVEKVRGFRLDLHHSFKTIHSDIVWFKNFIHAK